MPKHTVAVQTSPKICSSTQISISLVQDIQPKHFTIIQTSKLEHAFQGNTKPDTVTMHILAMESNLLYQDVEAWFKIRRAKWVADADKLGVQTLDSLSDSKLTEETLPDVQC